jgi:hypothetical protein
MDYWNSLVLHVTGSGGGGQLHVGMPAMTTVTLPTSDPAAESTRRKCVRERLYPGTPPVSEISLLDTGYCSTA